MLFIHKFQNYISNFTHTKSKSKYSKLLTIFKFCIWNCNYMLPSSYLCDTESTPNTEWTFDDLLNPNLLNLNSAGFFPSGYMDTSSSHFNSNLNYVWLKLYVSVSMFICIKKILADAQESPIGRYRLLSESDIDNVYAHDPHNNSLVQAWNHHHRQRF